MAQCAVPLKASPLASAAVAWLPRLRAASGTSPPSRALAYYCHAHRLPRCAADLHARSSV
eukprot:3785958-Prymnesium_polylepis.2